MSTQFTLLTQDLQNSMSGNDLFKQIIY